MGFIKLDRNIQNWKYYNKKNMLLVWIELLTSASYEDNYYDGRLIKKGQCVIGLNKLSKKLDISVQSLRTCINRLKSTGEITIETTNKYSIVTVIKWEEYQSIPSYINMQNNIGNNNPVTNKQQTSNKQVTTTKEIKEVLEVKESLSENEIDAALPFPDVQKELAKKEQELRARDNCDLFELLETEFGRPISQKEIEMIGEWQNTYEHRLIYYAIRETIIQDKKSFNYIDKILLNWKTKGYSVEDVEGGSIYEKI